MCAAYAHIRQDKIQPRALKCTFHGYPKGVKSCRLWCIKPSMNKCIISRDVTFNENVFPTLKHDENEDKTNSCLGRAARFRWSLVIAMIKKI